MAKVKMAEVVCIDDSARPEDIPVSVWPKKGEVYTVIDVIKMAMYNYEPAYSLKEISPPLPYVGYFAKRFEVIDDSLYKMAAKAFRTDFQNINDCKK